MNRLRESAAWLLTICLLAVSIGAQKDGGIAVPKSYKTPMMNRSAELQSILDAAMKDMLAQFAAKGFKADEVAATVIDLRDAASWNIADVRGEARIYPASVSKMFYMAALERQLEDKKVKLTPELERGERDMIVDSSNEATQYVLDVITNTSSGAEKPQKEFDAWQFKRNRVNRWFTAMGYTNININQKTFCEDAYGIERQSRNFPTEAANRNMLTTNATARLMAEIVTGNIATPERAAKMMNLMKRDPWGKAIDGDDQNNGFTGKYFIDKNIRDIKLWSKAGWTSKTRHDVAYVETADGLKFVIAVFTENHAAERDFIPTVAGKIVDSLRRK
ncbi:MAG: serine hydrolase [Pyrinomonadaceae bacterium]